MSDNRQSTVPSRFSLALARLNGDEKLLRQMAAITAEDLPLVIEQTEQAIAAGDAESAAKQLHKLKGMLSTFEAEGVALHVQEILDSARDGRMAEVQREYRQRKDDIQELVNEINALAA